MFDLGKMLRGASAQINPFDGGKTYSSFQNNQIPTMGIKAALGGGLSGANAIGKKARTQYEDEIPRPVQQGFGPQSADIANFTGGAEIRGGGNILQGYNRYRPNSALIQGFNYSPQQAEPSLEDEISLQRGESPLQINQQPYGGSSQIDLLRAVLGY
jgi:hypothetical protein